MPWQCTLIDIVGTKLVHFEKPIPTSIPGSYTTGTTMLLTRDGREIDSDKLPIGSMFYCPKNPIVINDDFTGRNGWPWYIASDYKLSDFYKQNNANRDPILVKLPGAELFCVDSKCHKDGKYYGGWRVTGVAPNITVSPSIDMGIFYHGFLQNGIIGDDVSGKRYDVFGNKL